MNKTLIFGAAVLGLSACASSLPPNFQYETSLRGQQGFLGQSDRHAAAQSLLDAGVVTDPALALRAALPNADIAVRKWGLRYFDANWERYKVVLDADIKRGGKKIKCREVSTEAPVDAPTLPELRADNGKLLQDYLDALVQACTAKASSALAP